MCGRIPLFDWDLEQENSGTGRIGYYNRKIEKYKNLLHEMIEQERFHSQEYRRILEDASRMLAIKYRYLSR